MPQKVATVVLDCISKNRAEVIVNTPPIRPLIVLGEHVPVDHPVAASQRFGYTGTFERVIDNGIRDRANGEPQVWPARDQ